MKIRIVLALWVLLGAGFISARADDNPAQAAARAALLQKMNELDHPQSLVPSAPALAPGQITPSVIEVPHRHIRVTA